MGEDVSHRKPRASWWRQVAALPRDVQIVCCYGFVFHAGWCAWERSVLPVWVAANSRPETVGYLQSVQGVVSIVVAPLIGYAMDHAPSMRPYAQLAVSSCACALLGFAYCVRANETGWPLYAASAFWGLALTFQGILMDTSITGASHKGEERTWAFALKSTCWRAGALCGQLLNAVVFLACGNQWSEGAMRAAIYSGLVLCASTVLLLLLSFEPPHAGMETAREQLVAGESGKLEKGDVQGGPQRPVAGGGDVASASADAASQEAVAESGWCGLRALAPQWVIFYAVLLRVLGKGMAMRFNPILLTDQYKLSPLALTTAVGLGQLISIPAPMILTHVATFFGRAPVMVAARLLEPLTLLGLVFAPTAWLASAALVVQIGIPIGSKSIEKSVLMDAVKAKTRARWIALESINRGTWAGSAALGGVLLERCGYQSLYMVAAVVVLLSVVVLSALIGRRQDTARRR